MIGIQLTGRRGAVAAWMESCPELIGTGKDLAELAALAKARPGVDAGAAVIAVPAWYHDGQRSEVKAKAEAAGIEKVRLINEPVAIALAYGASRAAVPEVAMVISVSDGGALDVSVLALREGSVEVLAANGIEKLDAGTAANADRLFAAMEPVIRRAHADAGVQANALEAIVLAGNTAALRRVVDKIQAAWGVRPEEPPSPETAIAMGAATFGRMLGEGIGGAVRNTNTVESSKKGCLVVAFALLGAAISCIIALLGFC